MAKGQHDYTPEELGLGPATKIAEDAPQVTFKPFKGEEKLAMQKVHHVVRTINKDNTFGQDGSIPLLEAENQLNSDWLAKGWRIVSSFLVGRNEGQFEICWVLAL